MEIKAGCKYNKEAVRAFCRVTRYKKAKPIKSFLIQCLVWLILLAILAAEEIFLQLDGVAIWALMALDVFGLLLDTGIYFLLPVIQYRGMAKLQNAENTYVFGENTIKAATNSGDFTSESEIQYSVITKVYETSRYFFLYQTSNQAFIVDKTTFEGGTPEMLRGRLFPILGKKYNVCRY